MVYVVYVVYAKAISFSKALFPYTNPGKDAEIKVGEETFIRHAIRTHFIKAGEENYVDIIEEYAAPVYRDGDILFISEKIITLCQNRVVEKKELRLGFWSRFLCRFVYNSPHGFGIRNPYKMALAIRLAGLSRVLLAALCSIFGKLIGVRGLFYKVVGHNISNIDGFNNIAFEYYLDKGLLSPEEPGKVCSEIKEKLNIDCVVVDANDIGLEILGWSQGIPYSMRQLRGMVKDNPAGQDREMTPLVLVRERTRLNGLELRMIHR